MKNLKIAVFAAIAFTLTNCIGTDEVEDTVSSVTIVPPADVTIVNTGNFAKVLGQQTLLTAVASSDLGGEFEIASELLTWSSDNTSIAVVDESGMVNAVGVGFATITVTFSPEGAEPVTDEVTLSVAGDADAIALIGVSSPENLLVIEPGSNLQLSGVPLNAGGSQVDTEVELQWVSSDTAIADVDQNGLVTAKAGGEVRITASTQEISGFIDLIIDSGEETGGSALTRTAEFTGLTGYTTSGDASLVTNNDGSITLQIADNFRAQNGPGLYFYLSNQPNRITGGVELGALISTSGAQEYDVPSGVELNQFNHIVLYCKPFGVGFGTAELSN